MAELLLLYSLVWILFHFGSGWLAHQVPDDLLPRLPGIGRSYRWEQGGAVYRRLGIEGWKDRLPEAGGVLPGGFSKRRLAASDAGYLGRFVLATTRAELAHWLPWLLSLTFFLWTPWPIAVLMVLYGAATNLPCILIQRYNRARLQRVLRRFERRPAVVPGRQASGQSSANTHEKASARI